MTRVAIAATVMTIKSFMLTGKIDGGMAQSLPCCSFVEDQQESLAV
jgi:hypothetical protein